MARASSRKFTTIELTHEFCETVSLEIRVHEDRDRDVNSLFFYVEGQPIYCDGIQIGIIPPTKGESPATVVKKLNAYLDAQVASKTYAWERYVRLHVEYDLHHLFYHQTPVVSIEEYYFAYDKNKDRWYQTASPDIAIAVPTESPPSERWIPCDSETLYDSLRDEAQRRSAELRKKIVQLKETDTLSLQRDLEIMLGVRRPNETQETNDFERILRDYST